MLPAVRGNGNGGRGRRRKYHLRPRIIDGEALAAGLFAGGTKRTFDVIFQREQEAASEGRRLQLTRRELLALTGIRSDNTLDLHIKYLSLLRVLVVTRGEPGDRRGNFYATDCAQFRPAIERLRGRRLRLSRLAALAEEY